MKQPRKPSKSNKKNPYPKRKSRIYELPQFEYLNWDFPVEGPIRPGTKGISKDHYENTEDAQLESICGGIDNSQDVESYDGTLGVTQAFVQNNERPVGQIQWNNNLASIYDNPGTVNNVRWCTGTLIANDLFLTAGHCFDQNPNGWTVPRQNGTTNPISSSEIATNMQINFNYQFAPDGTLRTVESFPVTDLVEYRLGGLDFAIIRIGGNPGNIYGVTQISLVDADIGDMLAIIQHPAGVPKRIEAGPLFHLHDNRVGYDNIDTLGGSSGSGILQESTGRIIGVHTNGGCSAAALSHNHGVRISSIKGNSPTIQNILTPKLKILDDPITVKFSDDLGSIKFSDDPGTLKFIDDPISLKFSDDPGSLKFSDDPGTLKFSDDSGSLKFRDDVKQPRLDKNPAADIPGVFDPGTLKFSDDSGSLKFRDDVKQPRLDKNPAADIPGVFDPGTTNPKASATPFILSTPHHSNAWSQSFPDAFAQKIAKYEGLLSSYTSEITKYTEGYKQNKLEASEIKTLERLNSEYEQVLNEYQQLKGK